MAEAVSAPKELFLPAKRKLQDLYPEDGIDLYPALAWL